MRYYKKPYKLFLITLISLLAISCSTKPNQDEINTAVKASLEKNFPCSWVGVVYNAINYETNSVEIIEYGKFNKEDNYLPIKLRIKGKGYYTEPFTNKREIIPYDRTVTARFKKDDYGNWKVRF